MATVAQYAILLALASATAPEWKAEKGREGITLESRPVEGSSYYEYRVRADSPAAVDALCDGIYEWASKGTDHPQVKVRKVLEDRGDTRVVYDQLEPPVVSKRELTFAITRSHGSDGTCTIEHHVDNAKAPKPADGAVRIEQMRGAWRLEPLARGTRLTYTLFAEPSGSVPAVLVHGSQREVLLETVQTALTKARRAPGR